MVNLIKSYGDRLDDYLQKNIKKQRFKSNGTLSVSTSIACETFRNSSPSKLSNLLLLLLYIIYLFIYLFIYLLFIYLFIIYYLFIYYLFIYLLFFFIFIFFFNINFFNRIHFLFIQ